MDIKNITREDRKAVAVAILKELKYLPAYITAFEREDKVGCSMGNGFVYWVNAAQQQVIIDEENETNRPHTVFAVIYGKYRVGSGAFSEIMESTDYLYVTDDDVRRFIKNKEAGCPALTGILDAHDEKKYGYIIRARAVAFEDEVGDIGVRGCNGGLARTF